MLEKPQSSALYQLRWVTRILAILILILVVAGMLLPNHYKVERSVQIAMPPDKVQAYLLQADSWTDWLYVEEGVVASRAGSASKGSLLSVNDVLGIIYDAGGSEGEIHFTLVTGGVIEFLVVPKEGISPVFNRIELIANTAEVTRVNWHIEGELSAGFIGPYLALMANQIAGRNFEVSLQRLQLALEAGL